MRLSFSASAIEDLKSIKVYYLDQGVPHVGERFVAAIMAHVETLLTYPSLGRIVPEFNDESIRERIHPPFRVVYLRASDSIQVIRVWRSERLLKLPKD